MVAPPVRLLNLHSTHDGSEVPLSLRVVGHGGGVLHRFILIHQLPKISCQIRGTSSKRSRIRLGIIAIRKHRLVSFFISVV